MLIICGKTLSIVIMNRPCILTIYVLLYQFTLKQYINSLFIQVFGEAASTNDKNKSIVKSDVTDKMFVECNNIII